MTTYNPTTAAELAQFIEWAYNFAAGALPGTWPPPLPTTPVLPSDYQVIAYAQAVDDVFGYKDPQYYGLVAGSNAANQIVVALRGTADIMEWLIDFDIEKTAFTIPNSGEVEAGFFSVFNSMTFVDANTGGSFNLAAYLTNAAAAGAQIVLEGHSLGGAIVALLAASLTYNNAKLLSATTVYTEAAPAPGDSTFASFYDSNAPQTFRIWNKYDIVPSALAIADFTQVAGNGIEIVPTWDQMEHYDFLSVDCNHSLVTYQWLLDSTDFGLVNGCAWPGLTSARTARLSRAMHSIRRRAGAI